MPVNPILFSSTKPEFRVIPCTDKYTKFNIENQSRKKKAKVEEKQNIATQYSYYHNTYFIYQRMNTKRYLKCF